ncbi:MAG: Crp/Fnr family transcriptional regulator [Bacteroidota bacterium]
MKTLIENINTKVAISDALEKAIEEHFICQEVPVNHILIKEGQYTQKLFFLDEGTVRSFHYGREKEVNSWFYINNQFFTCWYSFHAQRPSFENLQTLTTCSICSIDYSSYQKLMDMYPEFQKLGRLIAEEQLAFIDYYSKGYMFMSAKERYDLLLSFIPDIELRVKLGQIASFLGVSQETLSRIRSKR